MNTQQSTFERCDVVNSFKDDEISAFLKLKAFADDKSDVNQDTKFVFHRVENIVGKEENAGYQCQEKERETERKREDLVFNLSKLFFLFFPSLSTSN